MDRTADGIETFLSQWSVAEQNGDTAALEPLLADNFTAVGPLGFLLSRQDWLARHAAGDLRYEAFGLDEVQVRRFRDVEVAIALHSAKGTYRSHEVPESLRATLVVVSGDGSRTLAGVHFSFVAGTPGAPALPGRS